MIWEKALLLSFCELQKWWFARLVKIRLRFIPLKLQEGIKYYIIYFYWAVSQ